MPLLLFGTLGAAEGVAFRAGDEGFDILFLRVLIEHSFRPCLLMCIEELICCIVTELLQRRLGGQRLCPQRLIHSAQLRLKRRPEIDP